MQRRSVGGRISHNAVEGVAGGIGGTGGAALWVLRRRTIRGRAALSRAGAVPSSSTGSELKVWRLRLAAMIAGHLAADGRLPIPGCAMSLRRGFLWRVTP